MSKSKDASSKLHEKHQTILANLLRDEDNKYCADCMAKGPRWASWNLGVFMCIRCAGIHRNLGVHISRVKSVNLDSWTPEQIESIQKGGNGRARSIYEANLPANFRRPQDDYAVEQFIRAKYERKQYISRGGNTEASTSKATSSTTAGKDTQEQKAKTKPKKVSSSSSVTQQKSSREQVISVPRPAGTGRSPSPQPPKPTPSAAKTSGSNLISLASGSSANSARKSSPQPAIDLLTGLSPSPSEQTTSATSSSSTNNVSAPPSVATQPFIGMQDPAQVPTGIGGGANAKDSIMSLYSVNNQPQFSSYTAQGYPVNSLYYRQQQEAAMRMAHVSAIQQHQVNQVTAQMQQIKMAQQQPMPSAGAQPFPGMSNGTVPGMSMGMRSGGQTLNPTLW